MTMQHSGRDAAKILLDAAAVERTLGAVLKYGEDQELVRTYGLERLVD